MALLSAFLFVLDSLLSFLFFCFSSCPSAASALLLCFSAAFLPFRFSAFSAVLHSCFFAFPLFPLRASLLPAFPSCYSGFLLFFASLFFGSFTSWLRLLSLLLLCFLLLFLAPPNNCFESMLLCFFLRFLLVFVARQQQPQQLQPPRPPQAPQAPQAPQPTTRKTVTITATAAAKAKIGGGRGCWSRSPMCCAGAGAEEAGQTVGTFCLGDVCGSAFFRCSLIARFFHGLLASHMAGAARQERRWSASCSRYAQTPMLSWVDLGCRRGFCWKAVLPAQKRLIL